MKPAAFDYHDPTTTAEAMRLLAQFGEDARPLAGGQSLVPLMNLRLIKPSHLVDLNGIHELDYLTPANDQITIGAMTRQRQLERSPEIGERWALLREATRYVGHVQIRNRGTVGGSLSYAYPSAELPVAMVAFGASFVLRKSNGQRTVRAEEFFISPMTTLLEPDELLVEICVPALPPNTGWSFREVSRRYGDFALAGVAALVTVDGDGTISRARLAFTGPIPLRPVQAEELLGGHKPDAELFRQVAHHATDGMDQDSDIHASADYRRHVCEVLARRALKEAATRAPDLTRTST